MPSPSGRLRPARRRSSTTRATGACSAEGGSLPEPERDGPELAAFAARLGHRFSRPELLQLALTHPSHANEASESTGDNERLEFLGDAVLGLVVAEHLMAAQPAANEGELTHARAARVNKRALAAHARALGLDSLVRLGRGERRQGGRAKDSILANAFEAVLGALYLDGGLDVARGFLLRELGSELTDPGPRERDAKTALQHLLQAEGRETPSYRTLSASGPAHAREFSVEVTCAGEHLGTGSGASKRAAEQAAARSALAALARDGPASAREKSP